MNVLDILLYVRNLAKSLRSLLIRKRLVADTKYILGLFADAGRIGAEEGDSSLRGSLEAEVGCC